MRRGCSLSPVCCHPATSSIWTGPGAQMGLHCPNRTRHRALASSVGGHDPHEAHSRHHPNRPPPPGDLERSTLALPCRDGGLGLIIPASLSVQHRDSKAITHALVERILLQDESLDGIPHETRKEKADASSQARHARMNHAKSIKDSCPPATLWVLELASEKGASSWLTCCPLRRYGFVLNKQAFCYSLHLRYGWISSGLPSTCACGASFTPEHALSCPIGGYPSMRHK